MSPDNKPAAAGEDEPQSSATRKTRPQEPAVKCPRCDSPNTKFCYYNNYSLSQPRHFCKTCRRYWTKGGALRNVPIGGGCRKSKKLKPSPGLSGDSRDSSAASGLGGLKFFHGVSPAMDFQFGALLQYSSPNLLQFGNLSNTSTAISSSPCHNLDLSAPNSSPIGYNFPIKQGNSAPGFHEIGSLNPPSNLASSIESLSFINQDLHWKLQKQRLAMVLVGDNHKLQSTEPVVEKPQQITFQNLEISKPETFGTNAPRKDGGDGDLSTELFFDSSYATVPRTPATSSSNVNENTSSWSGVQAWTDLSQYSSLP